MPFLKKLFSVVFPFYQNFDYKFLFMFAQQKYMKFSNIDLVNTFFHSYNPGVTNERKESKTER
jgi:hypothetical protein